MKRNQFCFGIGTLGRDAVYTLVSMFFITYLTETVGLSDVELGIIGGLMVVFRIFDALNDPIMGTIVDNTSTKWGKFKPWITFGVFAAGILTVLMFSDFGLVGGAYIVYISIVYLLWGMAYTTNDISYWSLMPSISKDQKVREGVGTVARICANVGMFAVVLLYPMIPDLLPGTARQDYFVFSIILVALMIIFQFFTIFGVKEEKQLENQKVETTTLGGMLKALIKNDQLLVTAVAMALFMIGYCTTTSFGIYYFKYAYKDEGTYMIFAAVLAVAQLTALSIFPIFSKKFTRKQLYFGSMVAVVVAYLLFFFSFEFLPVIVLAGLILFFAQAFIQLLMLLFLADSVEYGEWKLGKRNESVSFAVQPFINKLGGAIGTAVVTFTLIISRINPISDQLAKLEAEKAGLTGDALAAIEAQIADIIANVPDWSIWVMKLAMMIFPLICILVGFVIYNKKFTIDEEKYATIIAELEARNNQGAELVSDTEDSEKVTENVTIE